MCSTAGTGNGTGVVRAGAELVCLELVPGESQVVFGHRATEDVTCREAESKCNQELCLSWLLAAGARKDCGDSLGALLAGPGCSQVQQC